MVTIKTNCANCGIEKQVQKFSLNRAIQNQGKYLCIDCTREINKQKIHKIFDGKYPKHLNKEFTHDFMET